MEREMETGAVVSLIEADWTYDHQYENYYIFVSVL